MKKLTTCKSANSQYSILNRILALTIISLFALVDMQAQTSHNVVPGGSQLMRGDEAFTLFPTTFPQSRVQMPIYSNELSSAGILPNAEILGISWEVGTDNTPATSTWDISIYDGYTGPVIQQASDFPFITGPFTPVATNAADPGQYTGTHSIMFDTPYTWDGTSNLILQSCRTSAGQGVSDQILVAYENDGCLITHYLADCSEPTSIRAGWAGIVLTLIVNNICATPSNINHAVEAPSRCYIVWDDVPGANWYDVHYRVQGTTDWTRVTTANSQRYLRNLLPNTWYEYFVRSSCDGTWDFGAKSELRRFNTANVVAVTRWGDIESEEVAASSTTINSIYPNPAKDVLNVEFNNPSATDVQLQITDISGRVVYQSYLDQQEGTQTESIDISELNHGYYILVIASDGEKTHEKFIVAD